MLRTVADQARTETQIDFRALTACDAREVHALYVRVRAFAQEGHLAERGLDEIASVLGDPDRSASIGAWDGARLVAYTLCSAERDRVYPFSPLIQTLQDRGEGLWTGKGTAVDPDYEGRLLMARLLSARRDRMARLGAYHTAGLIAVDNVASLVSAMRAGSVVVGVEADAWCDNFIGYGGPMFDRERAVGDERAALDDVPRIRDLIARGWIGTGLERDRATQTRALVLKRDPAEVQG